MMLLMEKSLRLFSRIERSSALTDISQFPGRATTMRAARFSTERSVSGNARRHAEPIGPAQRKSEHSFASSSCTDILGLRQFKSAADARRDSQAAAVSVIIRLRRENTANQLHQSLLHMIGQAERKGNNG